MKNLIKRFIGVVAIALLLSNCAERQRYAIIEQEVGEKYELNCELKYEIETKVWIREADGWPVDLVYYAYGVRCSEEELEETKKTEYQKALLVRRKIWDCYGI